MNEKDRNYFKLLLIEKRAELEDAQNKFRDVSHLVNKKIYTERLAKVREVAADVQKLEALIKM